MADTHKPEAENEKTSLLFRLWNMARGKSEPAQQPSDEAAAAPQAARPNPSPAPARQPEPPPQPAAVSAPPAEPLQPPISPPDPIRESDPVHQVWEYWHARHPGSSYEPDALLPAGIPEGQLAPMRAQIRESAKLILASQNAEEQQLFANTVFLTMLSPDKMHVWFFAFPPFSPQGQGLQEEAIHQRLLRLRVIHGIDRNLIGRLVNQQLYFRLLSLANGEPPIHGEDGKLIDRIRTETRISAQKNEEGETDYRSLDNVFPIAKGDVIYEVIAPKPPAPGIDVQGARVPGRMGRPANVPKIKNTLLSEDGKALCSAIDGQITFRNNTFVVENTLIIDGNVDNSVGNQDYTGDITVNGDVLGGFTLRATGNIVIKGMVESANIYAGGSITVGKGMNGNSRGVLEAGGDVKGKFFENCTVRIGGDLHAGSIIWSNVYCDGSVYVTSDMGVIIGGSLSVFRELEAKCIGSKSRRATEITLGSTPNVLQRRQDLEKRLADNQAELEELGKDLRFLESRVDTLTADRRALLGKLRSKRPLLQLRARQLAQELEKLNDLDNLAAQSRLRCGVIYPPTKLSIGPATCMVDEARHHCLAYLSGGEIVLSTQ